jgi:hypothetical protein
MNISHTIGTQALVKAWMSCVLCPKMQACIICTWAKGNLFYNTLLVVKASIWWALDIFGFFLGRANQSGPLQKKDIEVWGAPTLGCIPN